LAAKPLRDKYHVLQPQTSNPRAYLRDGHKHKTNNQRQKTKQHQPWNNPKHEHIGERGYVGMSELKKLFPMISEDTILRDMNYLIDKKIIKKISKAYILDSVMGSDHAPVGIEIEN